MFWNNFARLCEERGMKPNPAAAEIGFSSAAVTKWKNGTVPRGKALQQIAEYFGVSVSELLNDLPPVEGEPVMGINPKLRREQGEKIAVLSSVGAGIPLEAINTFDQDDPDSWEEISKLEAAKGPHYALRIRGNSMSPRIRHGDVVIVQVTDHYEDGDTVIALVNGSEGVCKVLEFRDDGIALKSTNPDYPPMIFTREQIENLPVRLMGKCVELRGKL